MACGREQIKVAASAGKASRAGAVVAATKVSTGGPIVTLGAYGTLVDITFTSQALVACHTLTDIAVATICARARIMARARGAVIDIYVAICSFVASRTGAIVAVDAICTNSAILARI